MSTEARYVKISTESSDAKTPLNKGEPEKPSKTSRFESRTVKPPRHNSKVLESTQLSFLTAFWVLIFALPSISPFLKQAIFGQEHWEHHEYAYVCNDDQYYDMMNIGNSTHIELVRRSEKTADIETTSDIDGVIRHGEIVWCGMLPRSYLAYWPNVVQFCFFSVYANTGTTIALGVQGVIGTFYAIANLFLLRQFFPHGAMGEPYNYWVCIADLLIFSLLIIGSKLAKNTKMFALSWHVCFMVGFMRTDTEFNFGSMPISWLPGIYWDSTPTIVMMTSVVGCAIAILATIVPWSPSTLLNIKRVRTDVDTVVKGIEVIWTESIAYFCGAHKTPKRFHIQGRLLALSTTLGQVEGNLANSFWETFDLFHFGDVRAMYKTFLNTVAQLEHESYCMWTSIMDETFDAEHGKFASSMKVAISDLKDEGIELLKLCTMICSDGGLSQEEHEAIAKAISRMRTKQRTLHDTYVKSMEGLPWISSDFSSENVFLYSVAAWARRIADFAVDIPPILARKRKSLPATVITIVKDLFIDTFGVPLTMDYLFICLGNGIPIVVCFMIGFYVPDEGFSVFHLYYSSTVMSNTLALLIAMDSTSGGFRKNLHRLIGVTIGNILPRLILNFMPDCLSPWRPPALGGCIFLYLFIFSFWYYTSDQFSYIGCLIGGFGCYPLLGCCKMWDSDMAEDLTFARIYSRIANVLVAILMRMLIEGIFKREEPRDVAVSKMRALGEAFVASYTGLFEGDVVKMREQAALARTLLSECVAIAPACDKSLDVVPGFRVDFKFTLYNELLQNLRIFLCDLEMLLEAMRAWSPLKHVELTSDDPSVHVDTSTQDDDDIDEVSLSVGQSLVGDVQTGDISKVHPDIRVMWLMMKKAKAFRDIETDFLRTLKTCFRVVNSLLSQEDEEPIDDPAFKELETMTGIMELSGVEDFYKQVSAAAQDFEKDCKARTVTGSKRVRLTVVIRSLRNATRHLGDIDVLCLQASAH